MASWITLYPQWFVSEQNALARSYPDFRVDEGFLRQGVLRYYGELVVRPSEGAKRHAVRLTYPQGSPFELPFVTPVEKLPDFDEEGGVKENPKAVFFDRRHQMAGGALCLFQRETRGTEGGEAVSAIDVLRRAEDWLSLIGWRWLAGATPIVVLYGASANPQLRAFGIYYSIVLVPFLALGASAGAAILVRRFAPSLPRKARGAGGIVFVGALVVGSDRAGYSVRPWRAEMASVRDAVSLLAGERVVLVQSDLYPHAGYSLRIQLLTPHSLRDVPISRTSHRSKRFRRRCAR